MTRLARNVAVSTCALVALCALMTLPLSASQGRGGGGSPPPPPPLPPAPVTLVNPTAADCYSGAGCLDPAFGTLGKVQQDIGGDLQNMHVIATQPDGKIVAAGARWVGSGPYDQSWVIGRFLGDGSIDTNFGSGGLVIQDTVAGSSSEEPLGVVLQADGKIVVGGSAVDYSGGATSSTVLIRLSSSGAFDSTFGTGGKVVLSTAKGSGGGMVLQPDGKIVIVRNESSLDARVTRFLTNGAIDKKFGSQGSRLVSGMAAYAMAWQSTGHIVLAGRKLSVGDAMLARLTSTGALDTSFGSGGSTVVSFSDQSDTFFDVAIASDDSIAAGGIANSGTTITIMNMAIARFTANGALVTGFGSSGRVVLDIHGGWDQARAVNLLSDGRVEFAGWAGLSTTTGFPVNIIVGRLTTTGVLDSSFGSGGVTETATIGVSTQALATAVGPDGLLTVGGQILTVIDGHHAPTSWQLSRYFR